eukprot:TRINITY_DN2904_c0_g1_i2.p1 TRINITY_DN2904_c0_g1~~TRINITY_DN2904_c0_g1_i2.p1  ORF type:complete len:696 (-),score=234.80 TRINITY_DN2904_c0_g1_i2:629-2716(-)
MQLLKRAVILSSLLGASAVSAGDHPIKRVIALIQNLADEAKKEGVSEADTYEKYTHWCGKTTGVLKKAMDKESTSIVSLQSKSESKASEKTVLEKEIESLIKEIAEIEKSSSVAADSRKKDVELYESTLKDFDDTIGALQQSIKGLSNSRLSLASEKAAAAALVQLPKVLEALSEEDQTVLVQLAQSPLTGAPAERKYDFKSGNIIDMLKKMQNDFTDQKASLKGAEAHAANSYAQQKGITDEQLAVAKESKERKGQSKADVEGVLAQLNSNLKNTKEDLEANTKSHQDVTMSCKIKADEFKQRTYMRNQEQEAMAYATKILSKVTGVRSPSFIQLGSQSKIIHPHKVVKGYGQKEVAVALLRSEAKKLNSKMLAKIAEEAEAHMASPDVATELDLTIQKQIWALKDEQLAEDKKKFWCDKEINKTANAADTKAEQMKTLDDDVQVASTSVEQLSQDVDDANQAINDLRVQMHEATLVRQDEKNENKLCVEDSQDAQKALKDAIGTLQKFYQDAGDAAASAAFFQTSAIVKQAPASWSEKSYTGADSSNVIKVLEETAADFAKLETDTQAKEQSESNQYDQDMKDNEKDMGRRKTEVELKGQERTRLIQKISEWKKSLKLTDRERELLLQYGRDLHEECRGGNFTYEDRKAARDEEMDAMTGVRHLVGAAFGNEIATAAVAKDVKAAAKKNFLAF